MNSGVGTRRTRGAGKRLKGQKYERYSLLEWSLICSPNTLTTTKAEHLPKYNSIIFQTRIYIYAYCRLWEITVRSISTAVRDSLIAPLSYLWGKNYK